MNVAELRATHRTDAFRRSLQRRCGGRNGFRTVNCVEPGARKDGNTGRGELARNRILSRPSVLPKSDPEGEEGAHHHGGGLGLGACQALPGDTFGSGTCRSGPCPHRPQTVMSMPVRRSIIVGADSASGGSGSGPGRGSGAATGRATGPDDGERERSATASRTRGVGRIRAPGADPPPRRHGPQEMGLTTGEGRKEPCNGKGNDSAERAESRRNPAVSSLR